MKIDNRLKSPVTGEALSENRPGKTGPAPAKEGEAGSVDVQLSPLATQLNALSSQLTSGEVVDAAKVSEIKQAISEGRFQIKPDVIADKLLQTVRELIQKQKP